MREERAVGDELRSVGGAGICQIVSNDSYCGCYCYAPGALIIEAMLYPIY